MTVGECDGCGQVGVVIEDAVDGLKLCPDCDLEAGALLAVGGCAPGEPLDFAQAFELAVMGVCDA
jgi:hypothetical protein